MAYEESIYGYSQFFSDSSDSRIVINKEDRSAITEDELAQVEALDNVSRVSKNDMLTDYTESVIDQEGWYWFYGNFFELKDFEDISCGRSRVFPDSDCRLRAGAYDLGAPGFGIESAGNGCGRQLW